MMKPRTRVIFEIASVLLMVALAAFQFISGAYRTLWWGITFFQLSVPVLLSLLFWSFRRDMRAHRAGTLVVASPKLAAEVTLAVVTMFMWIGFATYAGLRGFPVAGLSLWPALGLFLVWLVWFASAIWRARGYAFTLEPLEVKS
jgi:hypothetical protein